MAWIEPVGWQDPDGTWHNEQGALDWDISNYATHDDTAVGVWSGYLIVEFVPRWAKQGSIMIQFPGSKFDYQLDRRVDADWVSVIEKSNASPGHHGFWIDGGDLARVTDLRVRFKRLLGRQPAVSFFNLVSECYGPLTDICAVFHKIGNFLTDLADDISGIMFVGGALSAPFRSLAEIFHELGDTCCEVSAKLQDILDTIEAGITPKTLLSIIQANWPGLYSLITDPVGWFLVQLTLAFDLEPWHTRSLEALAKWILEEHFPTLYQIWLDPLRWLADILEEHFPLLYYLVVDPEGEARYLVGEFFDLEPFQVSDWDKTAKALLEKFFPSLYQLWRDMDAGLWEWLVERYEDEFEAIQARLYELAEHTLRFFWEGEW